MKKLLQEGDYVYALRSLPSSDPKACIKAKEKVELEGICPHHRDHAIQVLVRKANGKTNGLFVSTAFSLIPNGQPLVAGDFEARDRTRFIK